jgi:hypothetical protein
MGGMPDLTYLCIGGENYVPQVVIEFLLGHG